MENNDQQSSRDQESSRKERKEAVREEFTVSGDKVVSTVKALLREGNIRRIIVKYEDGRVLLELPLTVGVVGTLLLPVWAALGALAALVANLTIAVERRERPEPAGDGQTPATDAVG